MNVNELLKILKIKKLVVESFLDAKNAELPQRTLREEKEAKAKKKDRTQRTFRER